MTRVLSVILSFIFICACQQQGSSPKPRMFPRVEYPAKAYEIFKPTDCPFQFEKPVYSKMTKKSFPNQKQLDHDCWFTLVFPDFSGEIYMTYSEVKNFSHYESLKRESFEVIDHINRRSDFMEESRYENNHGVSGLIFDFKGPAASPMNFYLSDTSNHFLRASFYINTQVRPDSLAPIIDFIETDIRHMLASFEWVEE